MSTREQIYRAQLKELGIYDPAFEPEISTLADLERDLSKVKKAWRGTVPADAPPGTKPSVLDPHFGLINAMRREILTHREALGLTPKALRRLRGQDVSGPSQKDMMNSLLSGIAERVGAYDAPVSDPDTGEDRHE